MSRLLVPILAALPLVGPAFTIEKWNPLLAPEARDCYAAALGEASKNRPRPALARLESLLLNKPITVAIDYKTLPAGVEGYEKAVESGVKVWRDSIEASPFIFADAEQKPAVLVKFVRTLDIDEDLQGLIEARHEFSWSSNTHSCKLQATLFVVHHTNSRPLKAAEVTQVVAHELGHLLGLSDSRSTDGLMGGFNPWHPITGPSGVELQAVREFRLMLKEDIARIEKQL